MMSALHHDLDWVTLWYTADLSLEAMDRLGGGAVTYKNGVPMMWKAKIGADITVIFYPERGEMKVYGSPHKWLRGESFGAFGPDEVRAFAEFIANILGHPVEWVLSARLSRFDLAVTLEMESYVGQYLRLLAPAKMMREVRPGPGTATFKNTMAETTFYDKVAKMTAVGKRDLIPEDWSEDRMLRVEVRFKKLSKVFGQTVTVRDLCDPAFFAMAVAQWQKRVEAVRTSGETWAVPYVETAREMKDALAGIGIEATGGLGAMIERIDRAAGLGITTPKNATRQRQMAVKLVDPKGRALSAPNMAGELRSKLREAARSSAEALNAKGPPTAVESRRETKQKVSAETSR